MAIVSVHRLLTLFVTAALVTGCAATALAPGAERVLVSRNAPPGECQAVGNITGSQGNWLTGPWTSNQTLTEGALNELRNNASKLGATYVQLEDSKAAMSFSEGSGSQTSVTNVGTAYRCQ